MNNLKLIHFPIYNEAKGELCVYEHEKHVPFVIKRIFTVGSKVGNVRGDHAHKQCTQLLVCVSGKIRVTCDDGSAVTQYLLDNMGKGLLVPPGIWAKEEYRTDNSVLMVLCDRGYETDDYIRDYNDFKKFVGLKKL